MWIGRHTMLNIKRSAAAIPAQDVKRARQFYEQKLGLKPAEEEADGGAMYRTGETGFLVFQSTGKASGEHTQMALEVDDVSSAVSELKSKGLNPGRPLQTAATCHRLVTGVRNNGCRGLRRRSRWSGLVSQDGRRWNPTSLPSWGPWFHPLLPGTPGGSRRPTRGHLLRSTGLREFGPAG